MVKRCFILQCGNTPHNSPGQSFHRIPKNANRRNLWLEAILKNRKCPTKISPESWICSEHFLTSDLIYGVTDNKIRVKSNAVPSVFDNTMKATPRKKSRWSTEHLVNDTSLLCPVSPSTMNLSSNSVSFATVTQQPTHCASNSDTVDDTLNIKVEEDTDGSEQNEDFPGTPEFVTQQLTLHITQQLTDCANNLESVEDTLDIKVEEDTDDSELFEDSPGTPESVTHQLTLEITQQLTDCASNLESLEVTSNIKVEEGIDVSEVIEDYPATSGIVDPSISNMQRRISNMGTVLAKLHPLRKDIDRLRKNFYNFKADKKLQCNNVQQVVGSKQNVTNAEQSMECIHQHCQRCPGSATKCDDIFLKMVFVVEQLEKAKHDILNLASWLNCRQTN